MKGARECGDRPRQGLALFRCEKRIADDEEAKRDLPSNEKGSAGFGKVQILRFELDRPRKNQSSQSDPTCPGYNSESEEKNRKEKRGDENRCGVKDGKLRNREEQKQKR